jgi:hypothetical protein
VISLLGYFDRSEPVALTPSGSPVAKQFTVFDGTLYKHKPDMSQFGIKPVRVVYEGEFWEPGQNKDPLPAKDKVQTLAAGLMNPGVPAIIDIENWLQSPTIHKIPLATAQESVKKFDTLLRWFREAAPGLPVSLYGIVPMIDYWRAIEEPSSAAYQEWVSDNNLVRPLVGLVDALVPSLYTFYVDRQGWVKVAAAQIAEARRLSGGKPVYVFLWPQYHNSNRLLGLTYLPADYWKLELETARRYADGVIIWGGWGNDDRQAEWDEQAPWWKVTKDFLSHIDSTPPGRVRGLNVS